MSISNEQMLNDFIQILLESTDPVKINQIELLQRMLGDREFKMAVLVITNCLFGRFPEMFIKVAALTSETLDLLINTSNEGIKH